MEKGKLYKGGQWGGLGQEDPHPDPTPATDPTPMPWAPPHPMGRTQHFLHAQPLPYDYNTKGPDLLYLQAPPPHPSHGAYLSPHSPILPQPCPQTLATPLLTIFSQACLPSMKPLGMAFGVRIS